MTIASIATNGHAAAGSFGLHAPDGIVSVPVAILMWIVTAGILALAVQRTNRTLDDRAIPLMGVMAAFIFAAQMVNFPILGGTSGHLLGGVLAAVLLGPWAGTLVMACVVAVQALVFQDGGLLILGANIFNMGAVGTLGGYAMYKALCRILGGETKARIPAAGVAAWAAVMLGALSMSLQLIASGTAEAIVVLPPMLGVHAVIGIGEAAITMAAIGFIAATRADLFTLRDLGASNAALA